MKFACLHQADERKALIDKLTKENQRLAAKTKDDDGSDLELDNSPPRDLGPSSSGTFPPDESLMVEMPTVSGSLAHSSSPPPQARRGGTARTYSCIMDLDDEPTPPPKRKDTSKYFSSRDEGKGKGGKKEDTLVPPSSSPPRITSTPGTSAGMNSFQPSNKPQKKVNPFFAVKPKTATGPSKTLKEVLKEQSEKEKQEERGREERLERFIKFVDPRQEAKKVVDLTLDSPEASRKPFNSLAGNGNAARGGMKSFGLVDNKGRPAKNLAIGPKVSRRA